MSGPALCFHATGPAARVFVLGGDGTVLADDRTGASADPARGPTLAETAEERLAAANLAARDIASLVVDIGPGRLSAVRAGVSFANAFAFGRGLKVLPVVSSTALGLQAMAKTGAPAALVVHKAAAGAVYAGRVEAGGLVTLRHGKLAAAIAAAAGDGPLALIADAPEPVQATLPDRKLDYAGDCAISAETFARLLAEAPEAAFQTPPVHPINEESALIDG